MSLLRELTALFWDTLWPRCVLCGRRSGYGHVGHGGA